jgi:hypothetical protein
MTIATSTLPTGPLDTDHPLNRPVTAEQQAAIQHAPLRSNLLLCVTGASLIAESRSHFIPQPDKALARMLIGLTQAAAGAMGVGHYGSKAAAEITLRNIVGIATSIGCFSEGAARIGEAHLAHPQRTALIAFFTDLGKAMNAGVASTIPYGLAASCNAAEFAHGWRGSTRPGPVTAVLRGLHAFTHQWRTQDLASLQRGTGIAMITIAAVKTAALAASVDFRQRDFEQFGAEVLAAWDTLQGDRWAHAIERAADGPAEALEAVLGDMVQALERQAPSLPRQFAHVMKASPGEAATIIRRHPFAAREVAAQLAVENSAVLRELREHHARLDTDA